MCLGKNICIVITDTSDNIEAKKAVVLSPNFSVTKPPMSGPAMIPREKARPSLPKAAALPANPNFQSVFSTHCRPIFELVKRKVKQI